MKKILIIFVLAVPFLSGCLFTLDPNDAASAVALVAPQYTTQAAIVAGAIGKKGSASSSNPVLVNPTYREVWRYKGTVCDAADITRERILTETTVGAFIFADVPTATQSTTSTSNATSVYTGDAEIDTLIDEAASTIDSADAKKKKN